MTGHFDALFDASFHVFRSGIANTPADSGE